MKGRKRGERRVKRGVKWNGISDHLIYPYYCDKKESKQMIQMKARCGEDR